MKRILGILLALIMLLSFIGCTSKGTVPNVEEVPDENVEEPVEPVEPVEPEKSEELEEPVKADSLVYSNDDYGFDFNLPLSWEGYQILTESWEGTDISGSNQGVTETGEKIIIRNPKWSEDTPYQDIPIMIFTLDQWEKITNEEISVSAAPIGPSMLGENSKYVFALPARYNFSFPEGFEEVEDIMAGNPLTGTENYKK